MLETKNLYIVGITTIKSAIEIFGRGKYCSYFSENDANYIAAIKTKNGFVELFTDDIYNYGNDIEYEKVVKGIKVVFSHEPVTRFMSSISENISLDELTHILDSKNKNSVVETDYFLQSVLSIKSKVLYSDLSDNIKKEVIKSLKLLVEEYTTTLIALKEGRYQNSNNEVSEFKIKERFFKRLIEIEQRYSLYSDVNTKDLEKSKKEAIRLLKL